MNWKLYLVLAVIFLLLAGVVYYMNTVGTELRPTPTPLSQEKLWTLEPNSVTLLTVTDNSRGAVFSVSQPEVGKWQIIKPREGPADTMQMASVTSNISVWYVGYRITETVDLKELGLTNPAYTIEINLKDGTNIKAYVGNKLVGRASYYVRREGDPNVVLINSTTVEGLIEWIDKPPFMLTPTPTVSASQTAPGGSVTLTPTPQPAETPVPTP